MKPGQTMGAVNEFTNPGVRDPKNNDNAVRTTK